MWQLGKAILDHIDHTGGHAYITANAQHQQHEEEEHGKQLRQILKLGYSLRIRDKGQASAALDHLRYVRGVCLVRQIAQNTKDDAAGQNGGKRIYSCDNDDVSVLKSYGKGGSKALVCIIIY